MTVTLKRLPYRLAVCRIAPHHRVRPPESARFFSWTRTENELSVVCLEEDVPPESAESQMGWAAFEVQGPLDFSLTGILSSLTVPLATDGISVFALSTYDTDYLLVPSDREAEAISSLTRAGFDWVDETHPN